MWSAAACACSAPLSPSSIPISQDSSLDIRIRTHQIPNHRVSSTPTSPSPSLITVTDPGSNRVSKSSKKRRGISINGEATLELAKMRNSVENAPIERVSGPSAGDNVNTNGNMEKRHVSMSQAHGERDSDTEGNEATTIQEQQVVTPTNAASWEQQIWDQQSSTLIDQQPRIPNQNLHPPPQPAHPQHPGPCCGGCNSKPTIFEPVPQPDPLMAQPYFHNSSPFRLTQPSTFPPILNQPMQHMQPIATTIYTYPNGYTTINNPLTPQELQILQATGVWYSGAVASWSGLNMEGVRADIDTEHGCSCGPTCECLGCVTHPFNSSTLNFVRDIRNMLHSRHGTHGSSQLSSSCCRRGRKQSSVIHSSPGISLPMDYGVMNSQKLAHQSISPSSQQQHVSSTPFFQQIPNCDLPQLQGIEPSSSLLHQNELSSINCSPKSQYSYRPLPTFPPAISSPTNAGSPPDTINSEEDAEFEQNVVSPSAYFHIDYPLGQCSSSGIGCLCGEHCVCIGCLVHGNNMPITGTATSEQDEVEKIVKAVDTNRSPHLHMNVEKQRGIAHN